MKKVLALVLALLFVALTFTACGKEITGSDATIEMVRVRDKVANKGFEYVEAEIAIENSDSEILRKAVIYIHQDTRTDSSGNHYKTIYLEYSEKDKVTSQVLYKFDSNNGAYTRYTNILGDDGNYTLTSENNISSAIIIDVEDMMYDYIFGDILYAESTDTFVEGNKSGLNTKFTYTRDDGAFEASLTVNNKTHKIHEFLVTMTSEEFVNYFSETENPDLYLSGISTEYTVHGVIEYPQSSGVLSILKKNNPSDIPDWVK